jgi:predicted nucleic acid-binding protein
VKVFLDTSGWLAAVSEREPRHRQILEAYQRVLHSGGRFVTTNLVAAEMHILTVRHRGTEAGMRLLEELHRDPTHEVRYPDRDVERAAIDRWLRPFADHRFSLTDAVSFEVMREEGIRQALALDKHFEIAGFALLK